MLLLLSSHKPEAVLGPSAPGAKGAENSSPCRCLEVPGELRLGRPQRPAVSSELRGEVEPLPLEGSAGLNEGI